MKPPGFVLWKHNDKVINYESDGRININTALGMVTNSTLVITDVKDTDSGNYTCSAANTEPYSIQVYMTDGRCTIYSRIQGSKVYIIDG